MTNCCNSEKLAKAAMFFACCQDNDSVVVVLEKVASLVDKEEVARLAKEAEGRKFFLQILAPPVACFQFHIQSFALRSGIQKCD